MATNTVADVFPPGEFIKEELDSRGWTQGDLAAIIDRPLQAVNEVISGKRAITPETAKALAEAFGTSAQLWMNLDAAWRLSQSQTDTAEISRRALLYSKAPVKELIRRDWISKTDDLAELEPRVLRFMGMSSIEDTPSFAAAARKGTAYDGSMTPSQVAWLRKAAEMAASVDAKQFRPTKFEEQVGNIRDLCGSEADVRRIPRFLSEVGVRFVLVEHLPGTKMDGAAFWLGDSPVVAISMRHDRIDHLWFVLGHELGHVIKGDGQTFYDEAIVGDDAIAKPDKPEAERVADEYSVNLLIPQVELEDFINRVKPLYARKRIVGFANRIGVHPGIVVGQLQHRKEIGDWHSRPLLTKVRDLLADSATTNGWGH